MTLERDIVLPFNKIEKGNWEYIKEQTTAEGH